LKSSNIWIVDPAPGRRGWPAEPNILRNFALSLLFGLFGGVLLAFGLTKANEKIITVEQAEIVSPAAFTGRCAVAGSKEQKMARSAQLNEVNGSVKPELVSSLRPNVV